MALDPHDRPAHTGIVWSVKPFDALTVAELHDLLRLRVDIFVVEQGCAYAEIDGKDPGAWHVLGHGPSEALIAYARILPPHDAGPPHVGRIVVRSDHRRMGIAHLLMKHCLDFLGQHFGSTDSALAAQAHLEKFYAAYGYVRVGANYMWDGIPHVDMRLTSRS
jgi:ElaA protein